MLFRDLFWPGVPRSFSKLLLWLEWGQILRQPPGKGSGDRKFAGGHRFLTGDPFLGRFFRIQLSISLHDCTFAVRPLTGRTQDAQVTQISDNARSVSPLPPRPRSPIVLVLVLELVLAF